MRRITAAIIAIMMVLVLAACGGSSSGSASAQTSGTDSSSASAKTTFVVGMECDYAPYNWTQASASDRTVPITSGGYADGYDVQIARMIAEGLGLELVIEKIEWNGLVPALESGKIDAIIAGMSPTAERKLTIDFSDVYYTSQLVMVVTTDSPYLNATSIADFSGATIVGQQNTFHDSVIDQIPGVNHAVAMDSFPTMIVALTSGAVDGYVSEKPGALSAVAANANLAYIEFAEGSGFECDPDDANIAVGLAKGSALTEQINAVLAGITDDQRAQIMVDALANQPLAG